MSHTVESFIAKANEVHGEQYDYSKVVYQGMMKKVTIICKTCHTEFSQAAHSHINQKCGCPSCGNIKKGISHRLTTEQFIARSKEKHGDLYDYSDSVYVKGEDPITIFCKKCQEYFTQKPHKHMTGDGHAKCKMDRIKDKLQMGIDKFKERAIKLYGDIYDYSNVEYVNAKTKVKITCKKCEMEFEKTPYDFLNGYGCLFCRSSTGETKVQSVLKDMGLQFSVSHRFPDCKHKRVLPFDVFIPSLKIAIEYDGIQHFRPVEQFGGLQAFEDTQLRDGIKNRYCEANNIKLLRIPYTETDIERCIKQFLICL